MDDANQGATEGPKTVKIDNRALEKIKDMAIGIFATQKTMTPIEAGIRALAVYMNQQGQPPQFEVTCGQ